MSSRTNRNTVRRPVLAATFIVAAAGLVLACSSGQDGRDASEASTQLQVEHFDPQPIRIELEDVPEPFASESARKGPRVIPIPDDATFEVPAGFSVNVFADDVPNARWLAITPDGDVLCASSRTNTVFLLRDNDDNGIVDKRFPFVDEANGADLPFGMAFVGDHFYLGNTGEVIRYEYTPGMTRVGDEFETVTDLPGRGYRQHWTRNVVASPSGEWLYVTVGSRSNVSIEELPRASVFRMRPDGSERETIAHGLRNPVGLDVHPVTNEVYVTVNERDGLGDDLVPDYFTRIRDGEFYGWPFAYLKPEWLDPRRTTPDGQSENPELATQTKTPDVLFQSHSAALGLAFYDEDRFPEHYQNGAFVAFRGSWNRSEGTGYKIVFIPFDSDHRPVGHYEDFVRGFLVDPTGPLTWGRPVGTLVHPDGSLLFTEEAHGRIYRVTYTGP